MPRAEVRYLSADQVENLAKAMPNPWDLFTNVLAYGGLRFGEAAALRRRRVELERGRLVIAEAFTEAGGVLHMGDPKTHQHRTVAIPRFLVENLRAHLAGLSDDPEALLFTTDRGAPLRYSNFRTRIWNPSRKKAGLEWVTPHTLRHTTATLLLGQGATVKDVQAQLGHAQASVTLDTYGGFIADHADDLAAKLDRVHAGAARTNRARKAGPRKRRKPISAP